jgi:hypothetical protein
MAFLGWVPIRLPLTQARVLPLPSALFGCLPLPVLLLALRWLPRLAWREPGARRRRRPTRGGRRARIIAVQAPRIARREAVVRYRVVRYRGGQYRWLG